MKQLSSLGTIRVGLGLALIVLILVPLAAWTLRGSHAFFSDSETATGSIQAAPEFPHIAATVDIHPDSLEKKSEGKYVTAYIELPAGYNVANIDVSTVRICYQDDCEEAKDHPTAIGDYDSDGIPDLMVKFDRGAIIALIPEPPPASIPLIVTGTVGSRTFAGRDTIMLVDPEQGGTPTTTPTAVPSPTPTRTATPSPTPTSSPTATATPTPTPEKKPYATPERPKKEGPR